MAAPVDDNELLDPDPPYRRLACALLLRAVRDARGGAAEALFWLQGADAALWADLLELRAWPPTYSQIAESARIRAGLL